MSTEPLLPAQFSDLEAYARVWVLPTANERYNRRLESTMDEMQSFYDAMLSRGDEAFEYLDTFDYEDLSPTAINLLWLLCSLSTVSFAVDVWKQPEIQDSAGCTLPIVLEPVP